MGLFRIRWFWFTLGAFALDRASKFAIESRTPLGFNRVLIPGFFTLVHSNNPGLAFGLFADAASPRMTAILSLSALLVCAMLIWLLVSDRAGGPAARMGVALILGGALGNCFDRTIYSTVTDFLYFHLGTYGYPAFNLADSAIAVGAAIVGIELIFLHKHVPSPEER
ncbi:MAG TPA: signal peptidase II [Candidatus Limnocylindrales bacterium]|nr:signal peptidase II [Candidatus Limnocylindrales bacterium]